MSTGTPPNPDDGSPPVPRKLTSPLVAAVAEMIVQGNFRSTVAQRLRIGQRTFKRWMQLGKGYPDGIYGHFRASVVAAEAEAESRAVRAIMAAGQDDPKHLQWWLERKFPERWGKYRGELLELKREIAELKRLIGAMQGHAGS